MYIFGYGSLINVASRHLTGHTGKAIPAIIHGMVRHWSKIDESYRVAPLAVTKGDGQVNGVLLEVDEMALADFDIREAGYQRIRLPPDQIKSSEDFDASKPVWIYIVQDTCTPCRNNPIVMSYVDTVLAGCLDISESFAKHFVDSTLGWHHPLQDDREAPVYKRLAGVEEHHQQKIDRLISELQHV